MALFRFALITTLTTLQDARAGGDLGYPTDAFAISSSVGQPSTAWSFLR